MTAYQIGYNDAKQGKPVSPFAMNASGKYDYLTGYRTGTREKAKEKGINAKDPAQVCHINCSGDDNGRGKVSVHKTQNMRLRSAMSNTCLNAALNARGG